MSKTRRAIVLKIIKRGTAAAMVADTRLHKGDFVKCRKGRARATKRACNFRGAAPRAIELSS